MTMDLPLLLVSNKKYEIFEVPDIYLAGKDSIKEPRLPSENELIPSPEGLTPMVLPGCRAVGYNPQSGQMEVIDQYQGEEVWAVGGFLPPAYTMTMHAAFKKKSENFLLPLFAYSALGWGPGGFVSAAVRVDPDPRQDVRRFNEKRINERVPIMRKKYRKNRLAAHLLDKCCLTYCCPAARNWVLNRWEAPLPTTPSCNARCLGCISLQKDSTVPATQNRLEFIPTVNEITDIAIEHLNTASKPVVSFGQGCEGEPLLNADLIAEAVSYIRRKTSRGTININTNGYSPHKIQQLCRAGMDSFRISMSSAQKTYYERYYSPQKYGFEDVLESMAVIRNQGKWCSLNYFMFPGFTDTHREMQALRAILEKTPVNLIQMRNLNIDPDWYITQVLHDYSEEEGKGILEWMVYIKSSFPDLKFGYYNPYLGKKEVK